MAKQSPAAIAAAIASVLTVPAVYALLRTYDVLFRPPEQNPATIVWSLHIAMYWRIAIGSYVAGMVAPIAYLAARRDPARTMRALGAITVVVALAIGAQGALLP